MFKQDKYKKLIKDIKKLCNTTHNLDVITKTLTKVCGTDFVIETRDIHKDTKWYVVIHERETKRLMCVLEYGRLNKQNSRILNIKTYLE